MAQGLQRYRTLVQALYHFADGFRYIARRHTIHYLCSLLFIIIINQTNKNCIFHVWMIHRDAHRTHPSGALVFLEVMDERSMSALS